MPLLCRRPRAVQSQRLLKLLFDQNLSPRLVSRLSDVFAAAEHVQSVGLGSQPDSAIWDFAAKNGYSIVTKDVDFSDMSILLGAPPKVIWIQLGNCTTDEIENLLKNHLKVIEDFQQDPGLRLLRLR